MCVMNEFLRSGTLSLGEAVVVKVYSVLAYLIVYFMIDSACLMCACVD
jgi:hypothetical protein